MNPVKSSTKLSIIVPTLNSAAYLGEALSSLQKQNIDNWECFLVDGGSSDDTLKIASKYSFVVVVNQNSEGLYSALNEGLERCRGEVIGILNSDDFYQNRIKNCYLYV
jgi:glycosyltransferase involved in cell wall biosynthesis